MPTATVSWVKGMQFSGVSGSGHTVTIDSSPDVGGQNAGIRPMELVLVALGGCTGIDVVSILNKMRVPFTALRIETEGQRQSEHPQVYERVVVRYYVEAPDDGLDKIKRAVHLSQEKYCSVSAMVAKTAVVRAEVYLNEALVEAFENAH